MSLATLSKTFLNKAREGFFSKGAILQSTNSLNSFTIFLKMQEFGNIFFSIVAFKYVKCDIFTTFLSNKTRIPEKKFIIVDPPFNELWRDREILFDITRVRYIRTFQNLFFDGFIYSKEFTHLHKLQTV